MIPAVTYEVVESGKAVRCVFCGLTSSNPNDVAQRFCGRCRRFHEELQADPVLARVCDIFRSSQVRLGGLAQRALDQGIAAGDILAVCIEVDTSWRDLVDTLLPAYDWQVWRDRGEVPLCLAVGDYASAAEVLGEMKPGLVPSLNQRPPPGKLHAVVCVEGGAAVFAVTPRAQLS